MEGQLWKEELCIDVMQRLNAKQNTCAKYKHIRHILLSILLLYTYSSIITPI